MKSAFFGMAQGASCTPDLERDAEKRVRFSDDIRSSFLIERRIQISGRLDLKSSDSSRVHF
jgi:hypothetical protein